jgi:hypothetical protein
MGSLKRLLLNLDSVKAALLFLTSLAIASVSIVSNFGVPEIPIALVLVYSFILFAASHWFFVSHSEMTKNSPYFLAFLLFLVALFAIFRDANGDLQPTTILPRLGAALIPTIIGLAFRQLLFAIDRAQKDHDVFYRTLEEELQRNAVEFKKAQIQLVDLVHDFTETRATLLAAEERAARDYISHMQGAVAVFDEAGTAYPKAILEAITALNRRLTSVLQKIDQAISATSSIDVTAVSTAEAALRSLSTHLQASTADLTNVRTTAQEFVSTLNTSSASLAQMVTQTQGSIVGSTRLLLEGFTDALSKVRTAVEREHLAIAEIAQPIQNDLQAVDRILTGRGRIGFSGRTTECAG